LYPDKPAERDDMMDMDEDSSCLLEDMMIVIVLAANYHTSPQ
jgi:hypothetical protein